MAEGGSRRAPVSMEKPLRSVADTLGSEAPMSAPTVADVVSLTQRFQASAASKVATEPSGNEELSGAPSTTDSMMETDVDVEVSNKEELDTATEASGITPTTASSYLTSAFTIAGATILGVCGGAAGMAAAAMVGTILDAGGPTKFEAPVAGAGEDKVDQKEVEDDDEALPPQAMASELIDDEALINAAKIEAELSDEDDADLESVTSSAQAEQALEANTAIAKTDMAHDGQAVCPAAFDDCRMVRHAAQLEASVAGGSPGSSCCQGDSGHLLLMLLKGKLGGDAADACDSSRPCVSEGVSSLLPAGLGLSDERWETLINPFMNVKSPKRFVGADAFNGGNSVTVHGSGAQPCVLRELSDESILVMYKPSGWATCSTPHWEGVDGNLIRWVWQWHSTPVAAPCHRLDRGTSGIVVVAQSKEALRHICSQITSRTLVKQYFALCRGHVDPSQAALSIPLALSSADKPLGACANDGRSAITRYRVLGYFNKRGETPSKGGRAGYSLLQLQIDHGRQHQIRLHMASIGHPVVFDAKYNSSGLREDSKVCQRLWLHAAYVKCPLPQRRDSEGAATGPRELKVACRLPPQLKHTLYTVLSRDGSLEKMLTADGIALCDCLLQPEPSQNSSSSSSADEANVSTWRREEFLRSHGFSKSDKEEVLRILARLPSNEERHFALLQFKVLGERTPDFVVKRFEKYVEGLLKQKSLGSVADVVDDRASSAQEEEEELCCLQSPSPSSSLSSDVATGVVAAPDVPQSIVYGPVSLHIEHVTCEVCGKEEKTDFVQFAALNLRLSCRSISAPMPKQLARLLANASKKHSFANVTASAKASQLALFPLAQSRTPTTAPAGLLSLATPLRPAAPAVFLASKSWTRRPGEKDSGKGEGKGSGGGVGGWSATSWEESPASARANGNNGGIRSNVYNGASTTSEAAPPPLAKSQPQQWQQQSQWRTQFWPGQRHQYPHQQRQHEQHRQQKQQHEPQQRWRLGGEASWQQHYDYNGYRGDDGACESNSMVKVGKSPQDREWKLGQEAVAFVKAAGYHVDGPILASEFAGRFNAWVRQDWKRNDGRLRKWIGSLPGITIENLGGNKWKVHLAEETFTITSGREVVGKASRRSAPPPR